MPIELCRYVTGTILHPFTYSKQWGPIEGAALEPWAKNAFLPTILGFSAATDEEETGVAGDTDDTEDTDGADDTGAGVETRGL